MMTRSPANKRTQVRFGGPEDDSTRSAWKSANRSFQPPSPAQRKATIGMDTLEKTRAAAALVASLDAESNHEPKALEEEEGDKTTTQLVGLLKPSSLKTRSKTVPILKATKEDFDAYDYNQHPPMKGSRSAWETAETRHSFRSVKGPCPAQRQKTLEESDLRDVCDSIAAMANDSSSSLLRDMSTRDSSVRSYRGSSTRNNSIKDVSIKETPIDTQESGSSDDSGF